jgi:hypothetical protein
MRITKSFCFGWANILQVEFLDYGGWPLYNWIDFINSSRRRSSSRPSNFRLVALLEIIAGGWYSGEVRDVPKFQTFSSGAKGGS